VLPIENVFMCSLSNQPINSDNVLYINNVIYNGDFVHCRNGVAELRPDIVTLDDDDIVNSVIKTEIDNFIESLSEEDAWYDDDDDEWTEEEEEEPEENPYTIVATGAEIHEQITAYQAYGSLTPEEMARIIDVVSPESQGILNQINNIVTNNQQ
jgi:hypothetical protein